MNSFELNKILGAVLGTCLVLLALNIGANALFAPQAPAKPGFEIAVAAKPEGGAGAPAKEQVEPLPARLAKANLDRGKTISKQCQACHTFEKGGPNRVGPNLYGIVDDERGKDRGGFNFSAAMKSKGGKWTFDELDKFLAGPREYIPGTAMTFAGISNPQQRADVIAFLDTLADNPVPLPKAEAAAPAAGGAAGAAPGGNQQQAPAPAAGGKGSAPAGAAGGAATPGARSTAPAGAPGSASTPK